MTPLAPAIPKAELFHPDNRHLIRAIDLIVEAVQSVVDGGEAGYALGHAEQAGEILKTSPIAEHNLCETLVWYALSRLTGVVSATMKTYPGMFAREVFVYERHLVRDFDGIAALVSSMMRLRALPDRYTVGAGARRCAILIFRRSRRRRGASR
jgi:hypothetical protein